MASALHLRKIEADGKNWKDWIKQLTNYAAADNAFKVLNGSTYPEYDSTDTKYTVSSGDRS
ncbi:hypothetical protein EK21DRAFT_119662 [Setomelanomma holmii]|uniref:Uncharacterized protein n=1 Tax=Setomelanomma holmii TaxID=210430 RepID=A0A9P4LFR5_9PLEO|nr:hypothetical protein EK21DRAFT_119662 [Setomelanomma holmii]